MVKLIESGNIRRHLLEAGTLRKCGYCDFETLERKEMRQHERGGHFQDKSDQPEVKKYTNEEKIERNKGHKKWRQAK